MGVARGMRHCSPVMVQAMQSLGDYASKKLNKNKL